MADKMRWRYGDTNPVVAAVDSEIAIELGDLLWQDVDDAKPASELDVFQQADLPAKQFATKFLGVALQRSHVGDADSIRVASTGVFEFECSAMRFELGQLIAVDFEAKAKRKLGNQQVVRVSRSSEAIGRVTRRTVDIETTVLVDIVSTVMRGGVAGSSFPGV